MRCVVALLTVAGAEWLEDARERLQSDCWRQRVFTKAVHYSIPSSALQHHRCDDSGNDEDDDGDAGGSDYDDQYADTGAGDEDDLPNLQLKTTRMAQQGSSNSALFHYLTFF